jgi:hypothetical protein
MTEYMSIEEILCDPGRLHKALDLKYFADPDSIAFCSLGLDCYSAFLAKDAARQLRAPTKYVPTLLGFRNTSIDFLVRYVNLIASFDGRARMLDMLKDGDNYRKTINGINSFSSSLGLFLCNHDAEGERPYPHSTILETVMPRLIYLHECTVRLLANAANPLIVLISGTGIVGHQNGVANLIMKVSQASYPGRLVKIIAYERRVFNNSCPEEVHAPSIEQLGAHSFNLSIHLKHPSASNVDLLYQLTRQSAIIALDKIL